MGYLFILYPAFSPQQWICSSMILPKSFILYVTSILHETYVFLRSADPVMILYTIAGGLS